MQGLQGRDLLWRGCVNKRYRSKKYGEKHDICEAYKYKTIFEKYLDLHYEIKKKSHTAQ